MSKADFQSYLAQPGVWAQWWDSDAKVQQLFSGNVGDVPADQWSEAVSYTKRAWAAGYTLFYGIGSNPTFWAGAAAFSLLMSALSGYGIVYSVGYYVLATFLSYAYATYLPLKYFSSDAGGVMDPVTAAWRNSWRMFLPLLGAGLFYGKVAFGFSLTALFAVAVVEAGKHALFHSNGGYFAADRTMLTDMLERRLAVTGLSLPVTFDMVREIVERSPEGMDIDVKAETKTV